MPIIGKRVIGPFRRSGGVIDWDSYWATRTPTLLIVTAMADTTTNFSWTAGAAQPEGYKLRISTDGVNYSDKTTVAGNVTSAQATGLTAGVLYYFKVVAYKDTNESTATNIYDTRFKITVDTTKAGSAANTFVLPNYSTGTYNYYVDWGEGGAEENITTAGNHSHTYAASGTYQIKIRGTFPQIYFNDVGDDAKLMTIDNWGNIKWSSMLNAFFGCSAMQGAWIDTPNTTAASFNMSSMFRSCTVFNYSLSNFNTAAVTNMSAMFYLCPAFNKSISSFNTANVTNMGSMFSGCTAFNQSVSSFNTANVTSMLSMFSSCAAFNQSVSNFNTANVTNMLYMFQNCAAFNQSVSNFNTANVTNMGYMLYGCVAFNQSLSNFNTAKVTDMTSMLSNCVAFKQSLATFTLGVGLTTVAGMLNGANINATGTTTNYDATLVAWAAQNPPNSLAFNGGTSKYSTAGGGTAARAAIIADDLWTITDGGLM